MKEEDEEKDHKIERAVIPEKIKAKFISNSYVLLEFCDIKQILLESPVRWSKPAHEGKWSKEYKIQDSKTKCREILVTKHQDKSSDYIQ